MSRSHDLERRLADLYAAEAPSRAPDRVLTSALDTIETTRQRRAWWPARRMPQMTNAIKLALGGAAIVVASLVGVSLLSGGSAPRVGGPAVSPSSSPSPSPSPSPPLGPPPVGALDAGTYLLSASEFTRRPFTFTVPDGWRRDDGNFILKGTSDAKTVAFDGNGVTMAAWIVSHIYGDSCHWQGTLQKVASAEDVVTALEKQTGHATVVKGRTTIGDLPASPLELSVPADFDASACDSGFIRLWPDAGPNEDYGLPIAPGQTTTVYVVEVGGQAQLIVGARKAGSSPGDVAELEQVISSIQFE